MPTAEQLARLAAIGRQSVAFVQNQSQIGTISTHHRAAINRIRAQARQSIVVVDGQIEGDVPAVPGSVAASTLSSSSIRVTCEDVANENGYKWYRATVNDSAESTLVGTTGMNVAAFTDTGLTASTTYYYWVKATNTIGDSAFSAVASSATSAAPTGAGILGNYLGFFKLQQGPGQHIRMICRNAFLSAHPDTGKLYYATSGAGLGNLGNNNNATAGYIAELTVPAVGSITDDIATTTQAAGLSNAVEILTDYAANDGFDYTIAYTRIGGVTYSSTTGKLYVNFAKFYHTNATQQVPSLCEFNPSTFAKVGNYKTTVGIPYSEPNGVISCLHGTPLASYGDFMTSIHWGNHNAGPRQNVISFGAGDALTHKRLLYHTLVSPWEGASVVTPSGAGVFIGDDFVFPVKNGTPFGWYGFPNGTDESGNFVASPGNWIPDVWLTDKGYHAPPYRAYLYRVPTSQLIDVLTSVRSPDQCTYTVEDITHLMVRTQEDASSRTRYKCDIQNQLVKQDGYYYLLEWNADTTQNAFNQPHVVHVWSGDN